jgi:hypothetical protein
MSPTPLGAYARARVCATVISHLDRSLLALQARRRLGLFLPTRRTLLLSYTSSLALATLRPSSARTPQFLDANCRHLAEPPAVGR